MKMLMKSVVSVGLLSAVMCASAATSSTDAAQSFKLCNNQYHKLAAQVKADRPAITKEFMAAFKANQKHKDVAALKATVRSVTSKYIKAEFQLMAGQDTLTACKTAAQAKNKEAYLPLMTAYLANQNLKQASYWCNQAVSAKSSDVHGNVVQASMCSHLSTIEGLLKA